MQDDILLSLKADEINTILTVLGELPTKSGVWVLAMKIKDQAEAAMKRAETQAGLRAIEDEAA